MWLSSFMAKNSGESLPVYVGRVASAASGALEVDSAQMHRNLSVVAPCGIAYVPVVGEGAVLTKLESGSAFLGVITEKNNDLASGEIRIFSAGGASITLKNDGRILVKGRLFVNGEEVSAT